MMTYKVALNTNNQIENKGFGILSVVMENIPDEQDARMIAYMALRWVQAKEMDVSHTSRAGIYVGEDRVSEVVIWFDGSARFYTDGHKWELNRDGSLGYQER